MKEKLAYALLCSCLVFSLTACGGKEKSESNAEKNGVTEVSSQTEKETMRNEREADVSEAGGQQETDAAPVSSSADVSLTKNAEGYYEIGSADDFVAFARLLHQEVADEVAQGNHETQVVAMEKVRLTADIDLTGAFSGENEGLLPLGGTCEYESNGEMRTSRGCFGGEFDGNGHTISGIQIKSEESGDVVGLFHLGSLRGADVYIHDLTIANSTFSGVVCVGAIAGDAPAGVIIENCTVEDTVTVESPIDTQTNYSYGYAGGIVGYIMSANNAMFRGCVNRAEVSGNIAGGIVGSVTETTYILECDNYGKVTGNTAAGIAGYHKGSSYYDGLVMACINYGEVTAQGEYGRACGIVGRNSSNIRYCVNAGIVDGGEKCASLAISQDDGIIIACGNIGTIRGKKGFVYVYSCSWELGTYEKMSEEEMAAVRGYTGYARGMNDPEVIPIEVSSTIDGSLVKALQATNEQDDRCGYWKQGEQFPVWDGEHGLEEYRLPTPAEETD